MDRNKRIRRVLIVCCHCVRNIAYFRAGWENKKLIRTGDFWKGLNGNCMDIAVLEWCKLFGDKKDPHFWGNIVSDKTGFEAQLTTALGPGSDGPAFNTYMRHVRKYRDKFVAHLDDELIANIPALDDALSSTQFYHQHVIERESSGVSLLGIPTDLKEFYSQRFAEARREYGVKKA